MKRFNLSLVSIVSLLSLFMAPLVSAQTYWKLDMAKPAASVNSRTFNIQYTVLSTEEDSFTVELFEGTTAIAAQQTDIDPNARNGNAGAFELTNVSDGRHEYHVEATRNGTSERQTTSPQTVVVDATAPAAPSYLGKTRFGNTYTVRFTAPSDSDTTQIRVYSSTSTTFTAGPATQVGLVNVNPGQTTSLSYSASDGTERFHAVQAFDAAGNGSPLVGDPNVIASPARFVATASSTTSPTAAGSTSAATTNTDGEVQGTAITGSTPGTSSTTTSPANDGDVLGAEAKKNPAESAVNSGASNPLYWIGAIIAAALASYYWFFYRTGRSLFKRGQ